MNNLEVSQIFRDVAKILEIKGDNPFRIRAYERAAQNIEGLTEDIEDFINEGRLRSIPGIGQDLESKIIEVAKTGKLKFYTQLKKTIPSGLLDLLNIPSVGPRTAKLLYDELKVKNIKGLEQAIKKKKLSGIFGIKEKTIENISKGIELLKKGRERMPLAVAIQVADEFVAVLRKMPEVKKISVAGSLRRQKETVRDIDIMVVSAKPRKVMDVFTTIPLVDVILARGETKSSVRTKGGIQIDCRVVEDKSFGAAMVYFTGSKNFNIKLRQLGIRKGFKINEYGVFKQDKFIAGKTEEEVFNTLGMSYVVPEMREDSGEIELAQKHSLPQLVELKDIKGDLHVHSNWSDGGNSIVEMAVAAKKLGYSYIAITDHSQSLKIAGGLSVRDLSKKKREIEKVNRKFSNFRVLYGTEVDIDTRGNIDYPQTVLAEFDIVVAAIHTGFKESKEQITRRLVKAAQNKYVHIIAHPTGRLWGTRDAYDIEWDEFLKAARDTNTALEINSFPNRLDLDGLHAHRAKEMRIHISIDTDSHLTEQLKAMKLGIAVARRGWLAKEDVINTQDVNELLKNIRK